MSDTAALILGLACYLGSTLPWIAVARVVDDPYGHFSPRQDWLQAIVIGLLWPFVLVYLFGCGAYLWVLSQFDPRD